MYVLLNTLNTRLLGFEYVKEKYPDDTDFDEIYFQCELTATNGFFKRDGFLFKYKRLYVLNCSMRELQAHNGGLIWHFGITKTLEVLNGYSYSPNMKRDV